jgi:hypothetical protein
VDPAGAVENAKNAFPTAPWTALRTAPPTGSTGPATRSLSGNDYKKDPESKPRTTLSTLEGGNINVRIGGKLGVLLTTQAATGNSRLAGAVRGVDTNLRTGPLFNPGGHFGTADRAQSYLDAAANAALLGDQNTAMSLLAQALHLFQDDIGHRDENGDKIGWWEHLFRNVGDALMIGGCKFSPDCKDSTGYSDRLQMANEVTSAKWQEFLQKVAAGTQAGNPGKRPPNPGKWVPDDLRGVMTIQEVKQKADWFRDQPGLILR